MKRIEIVQATNGFIMTVQPALGCRCDEDYQEQTFVFGNLESVQAHLKAELSPVIATEVE